MITFIGMVIALAIVILIMGKLIIATLSDKRGGRGGGSSGGCSGGGGGGGCGGGGCGGGGE